MPEFIWIEEAIETEGEVDSAMLAVAPEFISGRFPYGLQSDKMPSSPPYPRVNNGEGGSSEDAMASPPEAFVVMVRCLGHSRGACYTLT
jgi:hypothetical protein